MLAGAGAAADTEIHRCSLADGTVAFQETPCAEPAAHVDNGSKAGDEDGTLDLVNPFDKPANPPALAEPTLHQPLSEDRAECEKTTRDAIDAIDLEMRRKPYTKEQGKQFLAQLLALTQRLRACKQL